MKLPKWAIKKAGGINKKAWQLAKGKRKGNPSRKKTTKTKTKTKTNRRSNKMFNFGGGLGKGIAVGVAAGVINKFIPVNIAGADLIIAGMIMKDSTVQKIGAISLGRNLATSLAGGLLGGGGNGGFGGY